MRTARIENFENLIKVPGYLSFINNTVVDRHFDADPDLDWHQNDAVHHADPTKFYICWKIGRKKLTLIHSNAGLQCFSFLISGKVVMLLSISDSILKFSGKKSQIHVLGTDTDPDNQCCGAGAEIKLPPRAGTEITLSKKAISRYLIKLSGARAGPELEPEPQFGFVAPWSRSRKKNFGSTTVLEMMRIRPDPDPH
jgi:hypothetical protein